MTPPAITCQQAAEFVCDARDRALQEEEQQRLRAHLVCCPQCTVAARQFAALFAQVDEVLGRDRGFAPYAARLSSGLGLQAQARPAREGKRCDE